jgi:hypothetical protein
MASKQRLASVSSTNTRRCSAGWLAHCGLRERLLGMFEHQTTNLGVGSSNLSGRAS